MYIDAFLRQCTMSYIAVKIQDIYFNLFHFVGKAEVSKLVSIVADIKYQEYLNQYVTWFTLRCQLVITNATIESPKVVESNITSKLYLYAQ